jgi:MFS family permease
VSQALSNNDYAQPSRGWVPAYTLFLLFMSNVLNYADRSLLGIVVDPVKADLRLTDTEMSIVSGTAFVIFNLAVGIFIARWVDRGNRKLILLLGVAIWSAATALTAWAEGFASLTVTRILVGVGEATAFPVAISMIADLFAPARRPRSVGVYQSSVFVGVVLGSILAGVLAAAYGWRAMFLICGLSGFVLGLAILLTMREPARGLHDGRSSPLPGAKLSDGLAHLFRIPGFGFMVLGMGVGAIPGAVLPAWAPTFLLRSHGVALANVGALIGPTVGLGGITGTIAAGMLASRMARRRGGEVHGLLVPVIAMPLAMPFYAIFCFSPSLTVTMIAATIMNFLLSSAVAPCIAAAIGITPPSIRALSSTIMLTAGGVIGGALGPLIVGAASDALMPRLGAESLRYALSALVITPMFAAGALWLAYRRALASEGAEVLSVSGASDGASDAMPHVPR